MTAFHFDTIETVFTRQRHGWHHVEYQKLPSRFHRSGGKPLAVISPDNRIKAWGTDLDEKIQPWNGVDVTFQRRGPNAFQAQLTQADADALRNFQVRESQKQKEIARLQEAADRERARKEAKDAWAKARADRVAAYEPAFAKVFGENGSAPVQSPAENARRWCYHLADKGEAKTPLFYWFRGAINTPERWAKRKPALEAQVAKELQAGKDWLAKWEPFIAWWKSIPKQGVYNDIYLRFIAQKFDDDYRAVQEQVAITEEHGWRGELKLAAEEQPLEEWPESEDWDDGYMWFRHTETGVLFPFNLFWLHAPEQRSPWRLNSYFSYNQWALGQRPLNEFAGPLADVLWFHLNKSGTTVGPHWKMTNRLMSFHGGYTQNPNHLYRPIKDSHVRPHAANFPPPVEVPLV